MGIYLTSLSMMREAHQTLDRASAQVRDAREKLASGKRVNSAKDDSAAISKSGVLRAQSSGSTVAMRHAQETISELAVVGDALAQQSNLLLQMHDLAAQAQDPDAKDAQRSVLEQEFNTLLDAFDAIALNTQVGHNSVLNGMAGEQQQQVGWQKDDQASIEWLNSLSSTLGQVSRHLKPSSTQSTWIEGSELGNERVSGTGADLRQLIVAVDDERHAIALPDLLTASELEQQINAIEGIAGVQVSKRDQTGIGTHTPSGSTREKLTLKLGIEKMAGQNSALEKGTLHYRFYSGMTGLEKVDVQLNINSIKTFENLTQELRSAFAAQTADLEALGIEASVDTASGNVTLLYDNAHALKPRVAVDYENTNTLTPVTQSLVLSVEDGSDVYSFNAGIASAASQDMDLWTSADQLLTTESFYLEDLQASAAGEFGQLYLLLEKQSPSGDRISSGIGVGLHAGNTASRAVLGAELKQYYEINPPPWLGRYGIDIKVHEASGRVDFMYDNSLDIAPKLFYRYASISDATSGSNSLALSLVSQNHQQRFQVQQGQAEDRTWMTRLVPLAFVPAQFEIDFSQMTFDDGLPQIQFLQAESVRDFALTARDDYITNHQVGGGNLTSVESATKTSLALDAAWQQLDQMRGQIDGSGERFLHNAFFNEQQALDVQQGHDRMLDVDMAVEMVRLAKQEMIQEMSVIMMQHAVHMGSLTLYFLKS
jgi:flagellin-like hook-associated protein FlgL